MKVPLNDLSPIVAKVRDEAVADFVDVLNRREFVGRDTARKLEQHLAALTGAAHVVACGSGTAALTLALSAYGIGYGDLVALPNVTFWATYEAVRSIGATPVLIDIDPNDLQMSFAEFELAISRYRVKAAILVHLYGWASQKLAAFRSLCRQRDIVLVEDGAQAFGVLVDGRSVFADAEVATLSFFPGKVVGGIGDGGAVLTRDARTADIVRASANHGRTHQYMHALAGQNSRISGINAAYLLRVLAWQQTILQGRRNITAEYEHRLDSRVRRPPDGVTENGYLNVTIVDHADIVAEELHVRGVECGRVYPKPISDQIGMGHAVSVSDLPVSRQLCGSVVNLPVFYGMSYEQLDYVVESFKAVAP